MDNFAAVIFFVGVAMIGINIVIALNPKPKSDRKAFILILLLPLIGMMLTVAGAFIFAFSRIQ